MPRTELRVDGPFDPGLTLSPLVHGRQDPGARLTRDAFARATTTPDGPASLRVRWPDLDGHRGGRLLAEAWGPGATRALDDLAALVGHDDDPTVLASLPGPVASWHRRRPGLRMARATPVVDVVVATVLGQKVQGIRAKRSWAGLVRAHGTAAPGPVDLMVPPSAATLAALPYEAFHRFDVERRRADVIRRVAAVAPRLEELPDLPPEAATARLRSLPGVGPWTTGKTLQVVRADPDAVVVGDYHLPHVVAFALAGEPRADDERMLELLAPYAGQRGRVQRLVKAVAPAPPRRGPRLSLLPITDR